MPICVPIPAGARKVQIYQNRGPAIVPIWAQTFGPAPTIAAIGTITARHNAHYPVRRYGRLHWVAIVPAYHGRGLGKPLLAACLRRMKELGYEGAYLTTAPPRLPVINHCLRFGFVPHVRSEQERDAWRLLAERVKDEFRAALDDAPARLG